MLHALRCSRLLLERGEHVAGRVLARHQRSLLVEWGADQQDYLWLLLPGLGLVPRACTCPAAALAVEPDAPVHRRGSRLQLAGQLEVELEGAELWDPLWRAKGHARREPAKPSLPLSASVQRLVEELAATPADGARLPGLVGLGEGSTPEGDDVLIAVRAAWQLRRHLGDVAPLAELDQVLDHIDPAQTHPLSRRGLRDAREGYYPEALARCLDALSGEGELGPAVQELSAMGGSSGRAFCWGLWLGCTWPPQRLL